jgi:hypothetical protein
MWAMTTLIAWAAIDQNVATAVYVASDSRLTWDDLSRWDSGRKIFASEKHPEILGYTGDALFCSQVLGQVISFIDTCAPMEKLKTHEEKFAKVRALLERAFSTYPQNFCLPKFSVFYLTRIGREWGACTFEWCLSRGWSFTKVHAIPVTARAVREGGINDTERANALIFVSAGSGGAKFRAFYSASEWAKKLPLLSRGIFGAFCDFISSGIDSKTGGYAQLSCLYASKGAQKIGYAEGAGRYLYGIELDSTDLEERVRWVNRTFENCEPRSGELRPGAQRQPAPYRGLA